MLGNVHLKSMNAHRNKFKIICLTVSAVAVLVVLLSLSQLQPRKKGPTPEQQKLNAQLEAASYVMPQPPLLKRVQCKIGILNIADYIGEEFKVDEQFQKCQNAVLRDPLLLRVKNEYYVANYSHVMSGREYQGGIEAVILTQAVKNKNKIQGNEVSLEEADIVFVDDFCFINKFESGGFKIDQKTRGKIQRVYENVLNSDRWKNNNGADFVFSPSFMPENSLLDKSFICDKLKKSFFILYEWANFFAQCNIDKELQQQKTVIMPYFSPIFEKSIPNLSERKVLASFVGSCSPQQADEKPGNIIRRYMMESFKKENYGNEVQFHCLCEISQGVKNCTKETSNGIVQKLYKFSKFCFIFSGDNYSTRRLTEVILNGCVPVFVGPPFHVLPLETQITYRRFAIFYQLDFEEIPVLQNRLFAKHEYINDQTFMWAKNAQEIILQLRAVSGRVYLRYLKNIEKYRSNLSYMPYPKSYPTATDMIFETICSTYLGEFNTSTNEYQSQLVSSKNKESLDDENKQENVGKQEKNTEAQIQQADSYEKDGQQVATYEKTANNSTETKDSFQKHDKLSTNKKSKQEISDDKENSGNSTEIKDSNQKSDNVAKKNDSKQNSEPQVRAGNKTADS